VTASLLEQLADLPKAEADALIRAMAPGEANAFEYHWRYRARPEQLPPEGSWRVWLLMAGRGFGKTRCGAEWVRAEVKAGRRRIALVGATAADARDVMVEGESGILAISPDPERPIYEPSKRRLTWPNGAVATTYSADEPERLRGPQHDAAWCDELGAWRYPQAWDMLMFGMRLGADPRTVVTTTPRPTKLIRDLVRDPTCVVTRGSSYENRGNLAPAFFDQIIRKYEGTRLGRQELEAELLEDTPGALWSHGLIEASRLRSAPEMTRVVVAIDPAVTSGEEADETGIVIAGKDNNGHAYVLADISGRYPPTEWARLAINAYTTHGARPHCGRGQQRRRHGRGEASHGRPKRGVYRSPRLARQDSTGRTGGGALRARARPSHRHLPATRRPDDQFYIGYRPGRSGVFAGPR
jgi:phage terminase large subunit-like protein